MVAIAAAMVFRCASASAAKRSRSLRLSRNKRKGARHGADLIGSCGGDRHRQIAGAKAVDGADEAVKRDRDRTQNDEGQRKTQQPG